MRSLQRVSWVHSIGLQSEFNINYLSVVAMITYFLPHLQKISVSLCYLITYRLCIDLLIYQSSGHPCFIIPVTSVLALVPGTHVPNYCATKAALHSFTQSLRVQLRDTNINILEIIPPWVMLSQMSTAKSDTFWGEGSCNLNYMMASYSTMIL